jgi:hypothetical protein
MPDTPLEQSHPHLSLLREDRIAERKKRSGFGGERPDRGGRGNFAPQLESGTSRLIEERQTKTPPPFGIQPHLVFRVPFAEGASVDQLIEGLQRQAGIEIVSVEPDRAVIAFRDDINLSDFQNAVNIYKEGPRLNPKTGIPYATTTADFLEYIEPERMRLWSREDRIGDKLKEIIGEDGKNINPSDRYVVDIELWHPGGSQSARRALDEVRQLVQTAPENGERVLDEFSGQFIVLVKVAVNGNKLHALLELDIVAEANFPPKPHFDPIQAGRVTARDFPTPPRPPEDGPRVCIIDSGITANHPLLANNIGHEEAILTQTSSPADAHGHGTMVAGLAVFGDVRSCYESRQFASPVTLFSARVLNDRNEFDDEKLIINQMRTAIETFRQPPYDCRVFNLSLGSDIPALDSASPRQSLWAEELDVLARELKIVLIVSAGNHENASAHTAADAETVLQSYPDFLFGVATGLNDPATAAIAVTVGALAQHDAPVAQRGSGAGDIVRPVASVDEPSPFTRIGPGINGSIKPELVHYGGNLVFMGFGSNVRQIGDEPGTAVMSLSYQPTQQLFAFNCGTSFAAPLVARLAALIEHGLTRDLGERPSPNLIRAVLASSADIPEASIIRLIPYENGHGPRKVCGYGFPSESDALKSRDRRVTMVYQGRMPIDHFNVFAVPIPDEFRYARGKRKIIITLAYDPPVRRRRLDYIGVAMEFFLIRGQGIDQVHDSFTRRPSGYDANSKYRMTFDLNASARKNCTLQRGECVMKRAERSDQDYGNEYYLVVRSERKWAPSEIEEQDFGLSVTISADDSELYNQVALRVRERVQVRARAI